MATAAYRTWVAQGSPWTLARPITDLVDLARAAGVTVLGTIGNAGHLTAATPEDHTPFSATAWPVPLPGYWVCACDLVDGPWSDRLLADARAGRAPWVKYLNMRGHHYNRKRGFVQESSTDQHLHVSAMSDQLRTAIAPYNPFTTGGSTVFSPDQEAEIVRASQCTLYEIRNWTSDIFGKIDRLAAQVTAATTAELDRDTKLAAAVAAVDLISDDQLNALVSRLNTAFGVGEIRQVLREELGAVRIVPGTPA